MPRTVPDVVAAGSMANVAQPHFALLHPSAQGLRLRPFVDADGAAVREAFADPDIQRWHGFRIDTPEQAQEWIDRTHRQWVDERSADWAIVDGTDSELLGRVGLHVDLPHGGAEIAYWVLPRARRRHVALRAVREITEWAHGTLGIHRILLQHSTRNTASCGVAERAGYVAEGVAVEQDLHVDGWHDVHRHAHLR